MAPQPSARSTRREFLGTSAAGGGLLLGGGLGFLSRLAPVSAAEATLLPALVRADAGVEPTVRLLEETPRERLLEEVAGRIRSGALSYREVLAALQLAGVRNVQPRPQVGFKFHAVLVINSAHLASLASPDADRWLPIFWALDRFKAAQLETRQTSGWRMSAVEEAKVPAADKARAAFVAAMDAWDEAGADLAAAALARSAGRNECFELFARYGARDWRDIGHKAIYVANSFRTLDAIGWQHAEPVLRSLAYALLKHDGQVPAGADLPADRPWRHNDDLAKAVAGHRVPAGGGGAGVQPDPGPTAELLAGLRTASDAGIADAVRDALRAGAPASAVWDAVLAGSAELLMRKPGIVALHAVTTANALRYAYDASGDPHTRLMMLFQAASFLPLFRDGAKIDPKAELMSVDTFEPAAAATGADPSAAVDAVFAEVGRGRASAARKALAYLDGGGRAETLMTAARRLVFLKGTDAHDYKFSSAVLEDYARVGPKLRNRFLAAAMFYLPGSGQRDNDLVRRTRAALGA